LSAPVGSVASDAAEVLLDYGLASYDAVHAATAIAAGAEAIVTTDSGFALVPAGLLSIYADRSRVGACGRVRQT
jgi:predicted nucleic acid-binding protein